MPYDVSMAQQSSTLELSRDADEKVAEQLNRILASKAFRQADRLKRFLSFIVEETLAGRGERLKEFVVGVEVFGKDESFDPRNDPIVRVQARRLRAQLARYYREEGPGDDLVIDIPKGGYATTFKPLKSPAPKRPTASSLVSRNTILVLPFADHSPAGDQKHFCAGVTQEIIHTLAGIHTIRLVASTAGLTAGLTAGFAAGLTAQDADSQFDVREAADRLNA